MVMGVKKIVVNVFQNNYGQLERKKAQLNDCSEAQL